MIGWRLRPRGWPAARLRPVPAVLGLAVATIGATVAIGISTAGPDADPRSARSVGRPAPPLAGQTLAGDNFDLTALHGHVVLVNIFASWCGPCRSELPLLVDAQRRWSARGLRVVGVDVRDGPDAVRALLAETRTQEFMVLPDPTGAIAVDWGALGVPETYLIGRDGRILQWVPGPLSAQWLDQRVAPLLAT